MMRVLGCIKCKLGGFILDQYIIVVNILLQVLNKGKNYGRAKGRKVAHRKVRRKKLLCLVVPYMWIVFVP